MRSRELLSCCSSPISLKMSTLTVAPSNLHPFATRRAACALSPDLRPLSPCLPPSRS